MIASYDPSLDPDFSGRLAVEVTGYMTGGKVAFHTEVRLELGGVLASRDYPEGPRPLNRQ